MSPKISIYRAAHSSFISLPFIRHQMAAPDAARSLDVLAALSHGANFSVGCYCESEARCHRSVLRALLAERGADVADS